MGKSPFTCRVSVEQTPQVREGADGGVTQHLIEFFGNGVPLQGTHQGLHEPRPDPTINIPGAKFPQHPSATGQEPANGGSDTLTPKGNPRWVTSGVPACLPIPSSGLPSGF